MYICFSPLTRSGSKDAVFRHHENLLFSNDKLERNCTDSQEHHGTGDMGWWVLGTVGTVSTETIEQYIERTEHV